METIANPLIFYNVRMYIGMLRAEVDHSCTYKSCMELLILYVKKYKCGDSWKFICYTLSENFDVFLQGICILEGIQMQCILVV
jgi:hypothetical protein